MIRRLALAAVVALFPALASAQMALIAPTAPPGDNSDRIANTAFVQSTAAGISALTGDVIATGPGSAVATLATVNSNTGPFGSATQCVTVTNNAKGLTTAVSATTCAPAIGSITGIGTGIATALGVNVGTAGSVVVNGGALGTPSSGVGTNLTGTAASLTAGNATKLTTPRAIGIAGSTGLTATGVNFDGSAAINPALTGTLAIANGGTGQTGAAAAIAALLPTPTRAGDLLYWNGTAWVTIAGNNSGTQFLSENASGLPAWLTVSGTGTVTTLTAGGGISFSSGSTCTSTCTVSIDQTAWTVFTPSPTATTIAFTVNSARFKTLGKTTFIEMDISFGTVTGSPNSFTFTLPATPNSAGAVVGTEVAISGISGACRIAAASTTGTCTGAAAATFVTGQRWVYSSVYENQ